MYYVAGGSRRQSWIPTQTGFSPPPAPPRINISTPGGSFDGTGAEDDYERLTLVVTDIDETLLGDSVSLAVLLTTLRSLGSSTHFAVATGRHFSDAVQILDKLGVLPLCRFIIAAVGTELYRMGPPPSSPAMIGSGAVSNATRSYYDESPTDPSFPSPPASSASEMGFTWPAPPSTPAKPLRTASFSSVSGVRSSISGPPSNADPATSSSFHPDTDWRSILQNVECWSPSIVHDCLSEYSWLSPQRSEFQTKFKVSFNVDKSAFDAAFPGMGSEPAEMTFFLRDLIGAALRKRGITKANVIVSHSAYLDVIPEPASKRGALAYLLSKTPYGQVVVAGDSGNDEDMLTEPSWNAIVVRSHTDELEHLRGKKRIYMAKHPYARGIIEGLFHYGVLRR